MAEDGKTGDKFLVSLLSYELCTAKVCNNKLSLESLEIILASYMLSD